MGKPRRVLSLVAYEQALIESYGIVSVAAKKLGVSREAVHRKILKHPKLRAIVKSGREESMCDLAESVVLHHLGQKDLAAAKFVLETQGKGRGYTKKIEAETKNEVVHEFPEAIPIKLISVDLNIDEV